MSLHLDSHIKAISTLEIVSREISAPQNNFSKSR